MYLEKRPPPWNTGHTKDSHPGLAKISKTFHKRKIDNFAQWREDAKRRGIIPVAYPPLRKNPQLAFLIGLVLGDGHIQKMPRCEALSIVLGTDKPPLIQMVTETIRGVFGKDPWVYKRESRCVTIRIYQKKISSRLGIPCGSRKNKKICAAPWIWKNKKYLLSWLRGLYEAEGSFCVHKPTYTYKFLFANRNESLLDEVYKAWQRLGFHPHCSKDKVQISKKHEVFSAKDLIKFREYD
ncbi:MAG: LAGLIDADG family homing endonuclease [Patescibacteria group bacterium]